ncbi:MAG: cation diffusion facilitator family transporter [Candidatus Thermoplasmatota archaeon]
MDAAAEKVSVARLSVYSNTALVATKLAVGVMMMSVGVISEALHSGIDLVAALIARFSVKRSAEPADSDHRFGHGKFENLSGMVEGALIFVAAAVIVYEAARRLVDPVEVEFVAAGMVVMGLSVVLNFYVSRRLMDVAKRTDSLALEADALHLKTDIWTSLGVFVALVAILITGERLIDPLIALFVAVFIIKAAYEITTRSSEGLLDVALPDAEMREIERIMNEHASAYVNFHKLRARKTGSERQIDLHLTVPSDISVKDSHDLAEHLEQDIKSALPRTTIVIHVEPCDKACDKCRLREESKAFKGGR